MVLAFSPFTKNKERIEKFKETRYSRYIYQNELDKACFQQDMSYGDFKDLNRRTFLVKVLRDKAFYIAKGAKYDGYQRGLASMVYIFLFFIFDKKSSGSSIKNGDISNKELGKELHKPIIRKFNKRKVHSPFIDNIWGAGLADMRLVSKFNKGFRFLLYVMHIYCKYTWVVPLKDKKGITITNAFQKILKNLTIKNQTKYGLIKIVNFNWSMKSWLEKNGIEMSSEEIFVIKNAKNAVSWTYVSSDLKGEEIVGTSYKNELQKTNQKEFRIEKLIKRKGDKLYVKCYMETLR